MAEQAREAPEDGCYYGWEKFEEFCDDEGIGTYPEDWQMWWDCWKAGYICAMNS